jgi:hypothetical protein
MQHMSGGIRTHEQRQIDAEALRLRSNGATYAYIAQRIGWANAGVARTAVLRALAECPYEAAEEVRRLEEARLDRLWTFMEAKLAKKYKTVSDGRVVVDPDTGEVLEDDGPHFQAVDRLLKIMDRRARLLGLDAAQKYEVRTVDDVDAKLTDLAAALAENDARDTPGLHQDAGPAGESAPAGTPPGS